MYCRICGCKVKADGGICPECGAQSSADFCGGFWGLVEEAENRKNASSQEQRPVADNRQGVNRSKDSYPGESGPKAMRPAGKKSADLREQEKGRRGAGNRKGSSMQVMICAGVAAVCLLFGVVQTVRLSSVSSKNRESQEQNVTLNDNNTELVTKNDELTVENKKLTQTNAELSKQVQDLQEKVNQFEAQMQVDNPAAADLPGADPLAGDPQAGDPQAGNPQPGDLQGDPQKQSQTQNGQDEI